MDKYVTRIDIAKRLGITHKQLGDWLYRKEIKIPGFVGRKRAIFLYDKLTIDEWILTDPISQRKQLKRDQKVKTESVTPLFDNTLAVRFLSSGKRRKIDNSQACSYQRKTIHLDELNLAEHPHSGLFSVYRSHNGVHQLAPNGIGGHGRF